MIAGFDGQLIAEQFLEEHLRSQPEDPDLPTFLIHLIEWRRAQSHLGPASSLRSILECGAAPLARALGFVALNDTNATGGRSLATSLKGPAGSVTLVVVAYGDSFDRVRRAAADETCLRGADWCLLFNGTHLRLLHATPGAPRRFTDFDLDAAADDERTARAMWTVTRAAALVGDDTVRMPTHLLVAESNRHGAGVCRSLRHGVLDASARVVGAFATRVPKAPVDELFAQSLTLVYRLLFLFFAEARGLVPTWHPIYRDSYSLERLCDMAMRPDSRGLWDAVRALSRLAHAGCRAGDLEVTAYNGRLFAPARTPLAELPCLSDDAARQTLMALSTRQSSGREGLERIAYRDLGVEQLGAVYETLLDYRPEITRRSRSGDQPSATRVMLRVGSSARKSTGSFYTPEPVVRYLVRRALGPLVRDLPPARILALRVLDPSMGSGAFLVGACRYLADVYAAALVSSGACHATDLGPDEHASIRRTVAERCLFGVDMNPMAVQLAQLSLWLATLSADKPLGFLDHHLVTGNSLLGAWLSSLRRSPSRKRVREEPPLFADELAIPMLRETLPIRFSLATEPTDTLAQVKAKERSLAALCNPDTPISRWKRVADVWTARWLAKDAGAISTAYDVIADEILGGRSVLAPNVSRPLIERAEVVASTYHVFHWELEFPEVFFDEAGVRRADAGFDAILGNPPWEMLRDDGDAGTVASAGAAARIVRFARDSGVYRAPSRGHANCYQLFLERSLALLRHGGRIGMLLPAGLASDQGSAALRRLLFSTCRVESLVGFENRKAIFPIHRSVRFLLLSAQSGAQPTDTSCRFGEVDPEVLETACDDAGTEPQEWAQVHLSSRTLSRLSGHDLAIPDVRSPMDLAIAEGAASRFQPLASLTGWDARFGRELNATEDRGCFLQRRRGSIPIVEGKHLEPFAVRTDHVRVSMSATEARKRLGTRHLSTRLAYRDIAGATNRLTLIAAMLPARTASTHTVMCLKTTLPLRAQWFLCGLFNSLVLNYLVRQRVTTHVTTAIVERLPVPTREEAAGSFDPVVAVARRLSRRPDPAAWAALQVRVARLYELTAEEFAHVLDTFPLVDLSARQAAVHEYRRRYA